MRQGPTTDRPPPAGPRSSQAPPPAAGTRADGTAAVPRVDLRRRAGPDRTSHSAKTGASPSPIRGPDPTGEYADAREPRLRRLGPAPGRRPP
ncbi:MULTISPECIES: hypothetical protein [Streptomyces]|uniref:Uncharacterized protein n=1 Tax=Streptomyces stelliscabiei TaxID=146820 RepID=A0A8I0PIH3_9ACTN|nr:MULTISPECIES: hypothetical protein [Streptomyces]MBE1602103.1 hypothetical protein [Streptomyces stelliscabiei]MDX2514315.1 hypothetical protein [Streptomyces stelliscabiei]MDX2552420.1 hypothetical protein [Streptomyces stelliscabiei]MDX2611815.1 hypothetical protein [Streptomyces stelliscabiei]MDX2660581.1 hypothetical protein [Streptomyces stelliscabiei]